MVLNVQETIRLDRDGKRKGEGDYIPIATLSKRSFRTLAVILASDFIYFSNPH